MANLPTNNTIEPNPSHEMTVSIIAAVATNNIIGKNNDLVWHLPKDLKHFKETTEGHYVIMGRKNWFSIPERYRPLPNRSNIVITRQPDFKAKNAQIAHSIAESLSIARASGETEAFIIGGGEIYKQSMELADRMYITMVNEEFEGDTLFPEIDGNIWKEISRHEYEKDEKHAHSFSIRVFEKKEGV